MKLYKDGTEIQADKDQLKLLLEAGWSTDPKATAELEEPTSEDIEIDEEKVQARPKKVRKPKKISIKE